MRSEQVQAPSGAWWYVVLSWDDGPVIVSPAIYATEAAASEKAADEIRRLEAVYNRRRGHG